MIKTVISRDKFFSPPKLLRHRTIAKFRVEVVKSGQINKGCYRKICPKDDYLASRGVQEMTNSDHEGSIKIALTVVQHENRSQGIQILTDQ